MAVYVLSERNSIQHVAWGTSFELEEVILKTCSAQLLSPDRFRLKNRLDILAQQFVHRTYRRIKDFEFADEPNLLLLIGMGPETLKMLNTLKGWREKCETVAAYVIDLYPGAANRLSINLVNRLDHLFVSYQEMVPSLVGRFETPVSFIPQACDVLGYGGWLGRKDIDVVGYGRQDVDLHKALLKSFNRRESDRFYFHSTFRFLDVKDWREDRQLFWTMMRRSRLALAHSFESTNGEQFQRVSPITARWFEAIAAGCCIVGRRPTGPEFSELFDWENSTLETPSRIVEKIELIESLLSDTRLMDEIGQRNYVEALRRHDWRYRLRDMLSQLDLPVPQTLQIEITELDSRANRFDEGRFVSSEKQIA